MNRRYVNTPEDLFFYTLYKQTVTWGAGNVSECCGKRLLKVFKIDFTGYSIEVSSQYLLHFYYRHFEETRSNQRNISFNDIKRIPNIINHYTTVVQGNKPNSLLFRKKYPDGVVEFVVQYDKRTRTLSGNSLRVKTVVH